MNDVPLDEVMIFPAVTHDPSTSAVSDADSAPTFEVYEDATDTAILTAQTMTKRSARTGVYRGSITCSAANGFELGKWYNVELLATVGGVAGKDSFMFRVVAAEVSAGIPIVDADAVETLIGVAGAGLTNVGASGNDWNTVVPNTVVPMTAALSQTEHDATQTLLLDVPTVAEFNARTILAASYTVVSDFNLTASGNIGIDWMNVENEDATRNLSDTTVNALGIKTGFELSAIGADLILKTSTFALAMADSIWDEELTGATHNITNSAGRRLRQIDAAFEITSGTAVAGSTSTTINLNSADGADVTTNEIYAGDRVVIVSGTGVGEHGLVLSYDASTQIATMSKAWVITPDNTSEYILSPADCDVELWNDNSVTGDGDWAALKAETALIVADTNELQTDDLPTSIAALQTDLDTLTAGVTLTSASVDLIWDEAQAGHVTAGTFGLYLDQTVSTAGGGGLTVAAIADGVWDELQSGHVTAGSFGLFLDQTVSTAGGGGLTVAGIADGVWDELLSGHTISGSAGAALTATSTAGVFNEIFNVIDNVSNPVDGAFVEISTDLLKANIIASGYTDTFGNVTIPFDTGGTYYRWDQKAGHNFTNPTTLTVTAP